jgi:hypothetical protein
MALSRTLAVLLLGDSTTKRNPRSAGKGLALVDLCADAAAGNGLRQDENRFVLAPPILARRASARSGAETTSRQMSKLNSLCFVRTGFNGIRYPSSPIFPSFPRSTPHHFCYSH